jgi:uncharacterized protein (TIGR03435 family)
MRPIFLPLLMAALASATLAQEFEVVSVKPNKSNSNGSHSHSDQGSLTGENLTLRSMILTAYQIKDYQLEAPDWLNSERFDLAAKFPEGLPRNREKYSAALAAMMQKMLADRFKLAVHRDQKTFEVYGLVVGKKGIKMKEVPANGTNSNSHDTQYVTTCITMDRFAEFLARRMDLPVVDMTGLTASYAFTLDWVPESRQPSDGKSLVGDAPTGPTLRDALQDQLGLKLETRKAPIEIIVVDHAERVPTEN